MPRGVYERKAKEVQNEISTDVVVNENVPRETIEEQPKLKQRVRMYSDNKDHKGEGEPLCLKCGHRQDMHYIERRNILQKVGKNFLGETITYEEMDRQKDYGGARPCQHACLCKEFE